MVDAQGGVAQLSPLGRPRGMKPRGRSKLIFDPSNVYYILRFIKDVSEKL